MEKLEFYFNEQLRDVPKDSLAFEKRIKELKACVGQGDPADQVNLLGELSVYLRISGDLEMAEDYLIKALKLVREHDLGIHKEIQQKIRLGHVLQFKKDFSKSNALFSEILRACEVTNELKAYRAFAWQHSGKNQFDQGNYQQALDSFEKAKEIRLACDAPKDQMESTLFAIEVAKKNSYSGV